MSTVLSDVIGRGVTGSRPSAGVAGRLYFDTSTSTLYRDNGATWDSVEGSGGLADQGAFTYLDATDAAAPANPAAGHARIYSKAGRVYSRDSAGVEHGPFDAAGGGLVAATIVPLDIDRPDRYPLHASGSEFAGTDMSGWSFHGNTPTIVYQQSDLYCDASATKFTPAGSNVFAYYKAAPAGNFEIILSLFGRSANAGMFGPMIVDSTGAGLAFSPYTDNSCYTWNLVGWVYGSSGGGIAGVVPYNANVSTSGLNHYCLSLKRVGTDYTIRYSVDGGRTWSASYTRTSVSFTVAYIGFGEIWAGGYSIYVDRFNVYEPAWVQYT